MDDPGDGEPCQGTGRVRGQAAGVPAPPGVEEDDGLRAELRRLRISRPALVLTKRLTPSDRSREKARLVLPEGLVRTSPLLGMLTAGSATWSHGDGGGLPVPAFDRLGRAYAMALKRDRSPTCRSYRLTGQWSLFASRHAMHDGDAVEVRAFRPPAWQARLESRGEGGLGMALLLRRPRGQPTPPAAVNDAAFWSYRERGAADGLLLLARTALAAATAACRSRCHRWSPDAMIFIICKLPDKEYKLNRVLKPITKNARPWFR